MLGSWHFIAGRSNDMTVLVGSIYRLLAIPIPDLSALVVSTIVPFVLKLVGGSSPLDRWWLADSAGYAHYSQKFAQ